MDNSLASAGLSTITLTILYAVYKLCRRGKLRSHCCGQKMEIAMDLTSQNTTPEGLEPHYQEMPHPGNLPIGPGSKHHKNWFIKTNNEINSMVL